MSIHRALAITRKEFRHILRDPRTFFLVAMSPAFLLFLLSHIFAFDVEQVDLALLDMDRTPLSRRYVAALTADGDLRIRAQVASLDEMDRLLAAGEVDAGLVIPPGFEADVQAGRPAQVQVALDGADPIAASQTAAALEQRTAAFAIRREPAAARGVEGLDLRIVVRYNPTLKSLMSMVPGLGAIVLSMPALGLALALAREKETGSFEGLIATPVRGAEYLLGKTAAYLISGLLGVVLAWLVAVLYFRVPFRGDLLAYLILAADYLLAGMGFSLFIANFTRSQQTTMLLVLTVFFAPSFFIAGLIAPVDIRDLVSRLIAYSLPATHFITISRSVFLKGLGIGDLWLPALMLLGMGTGGLIVSLLLFRKKLG
ncbi:MAG TPA: ABC transporter permease [Thermoflexia bacterium]|jgi:ABC-2 type transport system permease protein|nr:ABC transporter permease [Thermoflexia bacterium]